MYLIDTTLGDLHTLSLLFSQLRMVVIIPSLLIKKRRLKKWSYYAHSFPYCKMREIINTCLKGQLSQLNLYTCTTQKSTWNRLNVQDVLSTTTQLVRGELGFKTGVSGSKMSSFFIKRCLVTLLLSGLELSHSSSMPPFPLTFPYTYSIHFPAKSLNFYFMISHLKH